MSFPYHVKGMARVELGRKWGKRSAANYKPTEDWHTIELRALHDAMSGKQTITTNSTTVTDETE